MRSVPGSPVGVRSRGPAAGTASTRGMCPLSSPPIGCPTDGHGPARQSISSPTASKALLLKPNQLPARGRWECMAVKRSSSAWRPGCSTSFRSIWLRCCWAQECRCSTKSRRHRSFSGVRQSLPVWVSRICAIQSAPDTIVAGFVSHQRLGHVAGGEAVSVYWDGGVGFNAVSSSRIRPGQGKAPHSTTYSVPSLSR